AYSTLAQIGYLFLMFPLAFQAETGQFERGDGALAGGFLQAISHATAKAAMFMAAGGVYAALRRDRLTGLGGIARASPLAVLAFGLGGLALLGVPPSGASLSKDLLLGAAAASGQWWWEIVIQAGGFFTAAYLLLVLAHAFAPADAPVAARARTSRIGEAAPVGLALCSLLLGLVPWDAYLEVPPGSAPNPFSLAALSKALVPFAGGAVLAILLGRWRKTPVFAKVLVTIGPARRVALGVSNAVERVDDVLRQWPAAGLSLLVLVLLFAAAMLRG